MKNVARVDPKTNQLMYNPTYDELYIPKVLYMSVSVCLCDQCVHTYVTLWFTTGSI